MRRVVLISRDPVEGLRLAGSWASAGDAVTAVLLDAASASARDGHEQAAHLSRAAEAGVRLLAHDEALRRRAVTDLAPEVAVVDLDDVADLLAEDSDRVVWT